ncbi:UNVERIFIED_CONTAM: hypothetical protein PYX00_001633 [Menopon gallinae]|uniref:Uncharacterized protein n=1 Tax=Menopon gallinae TaxID=328185 RepID=A0AAW2IDR9_9NEOP
MGITWCRERLEQAQNSKNPVDRILIRCSNVMKPKTYSRSQDRLADDIVYRGVRKDNFQMAPPRSRARLRGASDWQTCALTVPDAAEDEPSVAPVPPPRKKRKRKMNGDVANSGSHELLNQESDDLKNNENVLGSERLNGSQSKPVFSGEELTTNADQKRQNRFIKLSENRGAGKMKAGFHPNGVSVGDGEEKQRNDCRKKEQKPKVVKNVSTVSLPNYTELVKPTGRREGGLADDKVHAAVEGKPLPRRIQSTISLPGEGSKPILSTLSEATIHRLETYMKRCRSFGSLKPQQLLEKLEEFKKNNRSESESSDSWSGLDDWDLGVIEYCDPEMNAPPVTPKSTLPPRSKIFSLGTPQETPRRQSPVSEEDEIEEEPEPKRVEIGDVIYDAVNGAESVPSDWFSESQKPEKLEVEKTKTPPPSPANGPADASDTSIQNDRSQPTLLEILTKYKEEEMSEVGSVRRESTSENSEEATAPRQPPQRRLMRMRSRSLIESNAQLQVERLAKRSPSISLETTRILDELARNSEIIEKELLANPEQVLNGLRRASMCENLPEDPFEVYISRKKPSLRESLSEFLGFQQGAAVGSGESAKDADEPPPLPLNPPPIITTSPPEPETSLPPVAVTVDEGPTRV